MAKLRGGSKPELEHGILADLKEAQDLPAVGAQAHGACPQQPPQCVQMQ